MKEKIKKIIEEIRESNKKSLESYKDSRVVKYVEILPTENSCENCKKWKGKRIPLEVAIEKQLLPLKSCCDKTYGYCRCCYIPVVE